MAPTAVDPTDVLHSCHHALIACMDSEARSAWRQANRAACSAVRESSCGMRWRWERQRAVTMAARMRGEEDGHPQEPATLPTALFAKHPALKRLDCTCMPQLSSLDGLPARLEAFTFSRSGGGILSFAPLAAGSAATLRRLRLSGTECCDLPTLSALTCLVHLEIVRSCFEDEGMVRQLAGALLKLPALQHLDLHGNALGSSCLVMLAPSIKTLSRLRFLDLSRNMLNDDGAGAEALGSMLQALPGLQHLNVWDNEYALGAAGAKALAPGLRCLSALTSLEDVCNPIEPKVVAALSAALLASGAPLRRLVLGSCLVQHRQLAPIIGASTALEHLELGQNDLGFEEAALLAPILLRLTRLTALLLPGNSFGQEGADALAPALKQMTQMTQLQLERSMLGGGAGALAPALCGLRRLRSLMLGDNGFSAAEVAVLAPSLHGLTALTRLGLQGTTGCLGADGGAEVAAALVHLTGLQELHLSSCGLCPEGVAALAPALGALTALTTLHLWGNAMGGGGAAVLAPALARLTALRLLSLCRNRLDAAAAAPLATVIKSLPRIERLVLGRAHLWQDAGLPGLDPWEVDGVSAEELDLDGAEEVDWDGEEEGEMGDSWDWGERGDEGEGEVGEGEQGEGEVGEGEMGEGEEGKGEVGQGEKGKGEG